MGDASLQVFTEGGGAACCYAGFHGPGEYDPSMGIWGGWRFFLEDDECPTAVAELYPVGYGGGNTLWQLETIVPEEPPDVQNVTSGDGVWPLFNPGLGGWSPCPGSNVALILSGL